MWCDCDYCGECDDYDNFDDFQCVIAGPGQGLHRHPIINYHYHYLLNYSRPKTRATMSSIINYNYHYLLDYSRPKTRATAPVQKLRRGQLKTTLAISPGELVMMMMMIYILWWVSVCVFVTKNDHFLLGVSCNHLNPPITTLSNSRLVLMVPDWFFMVPCRFL